MDLLASLAPFPSPACRGEGISARSKSPGALALPLILAACGLLAGIPHSAFAQPAAQAAPAADEIQRFCSNIADAARDRRYALQAKELEDLQRDIDRRIKLLEAKRAEYEDWLKRRNDFAAMAETSVVQIYAKMKPASAAERLADLKPELAAAILLKLNPRQSGQILNEIDPKIAATLTGIMAAAARKVDPS
jgi:flagellar motility protein MotE (MotC chaperone)